MSSLSNAAAHKNLIGAPSVLNQNSSEGSHPILVVQYERAENMPSATVYTVNEDQ